MGELDLHIDGKELVVSVCPMCVEADKDVAEELRVMQAGIQVVVEEVLCIDHMN